MAEACHRVGSTIAFEPVAGPATGQVLSAMPAGSVVVVYGMLSTELCSAIDPGALIFEHERVEGFWLNPWIMRKSLIGKVRLTRRVQTLIRAGVLDSEIGIRLKLENLVEGLIEYQTHMTQRKALIMPHFR